MPGARAGTKSGRTPSSEVSVAVSELEALVAANTELDPASLKALAQHVARLRDLVDAPPTSLAEGGLGSLNAIQEDSPTNDDSDPTLDYGFGPEERERLERAWMRLCWVARRDMCEDEMLVLTEKTFRRLVHCYSIEAEEDCVAYWRFLVKLRQENAKIRSACATAVDAEKPKERNAGDVVTASAVTSQRSKALPTGVSSGVYNPEVFSPTAALWAKKPEERAASLRRSTERAQSVAGTAKASPSPRRATSAKGSELDAASLRSGGVRSPKAASGNLAGTDKVDGKHVVDTGDKSAARKPHGKGFKNSTGWVMRF
jgi:hypothetical protein